SVGCFAMPQAAIAVWTGRRPFATKDVYLPAMMLTGARRARQLLTERSPHMALGLLGLKVGMTQVYDAEGKIAPVTVLQVGPCPVLQIRNQERDKYDALQLGFQDKARRKATRPERGHVSANLESKRRQARARPGVA